MRRTPLSKQQASGVSPKNIQPPNVMVVLLCKVQPICQIVVRSSVNHLPCLSARFVGHATGATLQVSSLWDYFYKRNSDEFITNTRDAQTSFGGTTPTDAFAAMVAQLLSSAMRSNDDNE